MQAMLQKILSANPSAWIHSSFFVKECKHNRIHMFHFPPPKIVLYPFNFMPTVNQVNPRICGRTLVTHKDDCKFINQKSSDIYDCYTFCIMYQARQDMYLQGWGPCFKKNPAFTLSPPHMVSALCMKLRQAKYHHCVEGLLKAEMTLCHPPYMHK